MAVNMITHKLLTLDYWQDRVTYAGQSLPCGTVGCGALNIPDGVIEKLDALRGSLNIFMGALQLGMATEAQLQTAGVAALQIAEELRNVQPFSLLDYDACRAYIQSAFTPESLQNVKEYLTALTAGETIGLGDPRYDTAMVLLRIVPVLGHLGYSLGEFKKIMTDFAEKLHTLPERTPESYAAVFGAYFANTPTLDESNPAWMSLANISVQYVSAVLPGEDTPQLVKRMHYVSFVGMFRSDLYEGLCVGHAPRKCPICGKWFPTTDARHTKYCDGLAPGDKRGRTCRQVGNLRGRAERELAEDHPIKKIYARRVNTILQCTHRGTLDEATAEVMKRLAKNKEERALSDRRYAAAAYEKEMTQKALLEEAQKRVQP